MAMNETSIDQRVERSVHSLVHSDRTTLGSVTRPWSARTRAGCVAGSGDASALMLPP